MGRKSNHLGRCAVLTPRLPLTGGSRGLEIIITSSQQLAKIGLVWLIDKMNKNITARVLNMEEKRKIEKLIFADIEKAKNDYQNTRGKKRDAIIATLKANPSKEAVNLFNEYTKAKETEKRTENALKKLGFHPYHGYQDKLHLEVSTYGDIPETLKTFDRDEEKKCNKLDALKRNYTLKLYAGGEEAQEIFKELAKELENLLK